MGNSVGIHSLQGLFTKNSLGKNGFEFLFARRKHE